jgi:uncharacterized protein YbjT (DUF2867 family)
VAVLGDSRGDSQPVAPRAFVAGATGYTGGHVVSVLADRRVDTIAHVRLDSPALEEWRARFTTPAVDQTRGPVCVDTTSWNESAMTATLSAAKPTMVFALLGTTRARGRRAREGGAVDTYETVDYGLTMVLLRAAVASGRATGVWPRFVYLSALGASAKSPSAYMAVRGRVEDALRGSGLSYAIARPSLITGDDRRESRPVERVAELVMGAGLGILAAVGAGGPRNRYGSLTGGALADALVQLAIDPSDANVVADAQELRRLAAG